MSLFGRRERREIAELNAYVDRLRSQRDTARVDRDASVSAAAHAARLYAEADATNRRLDDRCRVLAKRIRAFHSGETEARRLRWARLAGARLLAAYVVEKRRADLLQARLDDACGLDHPAVDAGQHWQARRNDKPTSKETP